MIYARQLIRPKNLQERTRLRRAPNEHLYGARRPCAFTADVEAIPALTKHYDRRQMEC